MGHSTPWLARNTLLHSLDVPIRVVPELVARGDEAVEALEENIFKRLDGTSVPDWRYAILTLEKICTPRAKDALHRLVKRIPAAPEFKRYGWEAHAVVAFAHCGGAEAVDELLALSATTTQPHSSALLLSALARTGIRRAVLFVLQHPDALVNDVDRSKPTWDADLSALVLRALMDVNGVQDLRFLPLHRRGILYAGGTRINELVQETYWVDGESPREADRVLLEWREKSPRLAARWEQMLQQ